MFRTRSSGPVPGAEHVTDADRPVSFRTMTVPPSAPAEPDERPGGRHDGLPEPLGDSRHLAPLSAREATAATCPYLTSAGGSWRHATPSRDHRCGALDPPGPQPTDKQRRHCLSADHVECSIFLVAREARAATLIPSGDPAVVAAMDAARRPIARTAPILLEQPRLVEQAIRLPFDRGPGQLALVALMILAFTVVAIARLSGGSSAAPGTSAAPSVIVGPSSDPPPTIAPTPSPSVEPPAALAPSVEPSFSTTYTVQKGDTLAVIAGRYSTTVAAIRDLNGLTGNAIRTGQVLKIP
jgi:LysM repeat protein